MYTQHKLAGLRKFVWIRKWSKLKSDETVINWITKYWRCCLVFYCFLSPQNPLKSFMTELAWTLTRKSHLSILVFEHTRIQKCSLFSVVSLPIFSFIEHIELTMTKFFLHCTPFYIWLNQMSNDNNPHLKMDFKLLYKNILNVIPY